MIVADDGQRGQLPCGKHCGWQIFPSNFDEHEAGKKRRCPLGSKEHVAA
ncbi:hypothetical protein CEV33_3167 [Brucella grignonensis]|uniref:Uncharacterized protein n=1 Tax=Brucella grignonensis TaxID=94627 RepID=A0A256F1V6_9HYPH|nr:hypothetical protein CEV33_3167 [Brucella grignonensis]